MKVFVTDGPGPGLCSSDRKMVFLHFSAPLHLYAASGTTGRLHLDALSEGFPAEPRLCSCLFQCTYSFAVSGSVQLIQVLLMFRR